MWIYYLKFGIANHEEILIEMQKCEKNLIA